MAKEVVLSQNEEGEGGGGAPTNSVGSGGFAGLNGDPPGPSNVLARLKRKAPVLQNEDAPADNQDDEITSFAGHRVFEVDGDRFHKCRLGKNRYHSYARYVGNDALGEEIRAFGRKNPKKPIIVKHKDNGAMIFLRYQK